MNGISTDGLACLPTRGKSRWRSNGRWSPFGSAKSVARMRECLKQQNWNEMAIIANETDEENIHELALTEFQALHFEGLNRAALEELRHALNWARAGRNRLYRWCHSRGSKAGREVAAYTNVSHKGQKLQELLELREPCAVSAQL